MLDYAWLMLLFPAIGLIVISLLGTRLSKNIVGWLASLVVALSFMVAAAVFVQMLGLPPEERSQRVPLWSWMVAGDFQVSAALLVDQLSIVMALVVTGIGFLIHVYSIGYMHDDPRVPRFFAYLNLFILMMLVLVLADNYLMLYVGWEGVGLASYLLIGFWYEKPSAADAGKKAFLVNRVGDLGLLIAIMIIWTSLGTLQFNEVFERAEALWAVGGSVVVTVTLLMLLGATGKSAQIPLFVWLPDAMEGPTPVSALIHAATMVTAGVYLIARSSLLYAMAPVSATLVAVIGVTTAIFAASIALTQVDLKRILAYSTISQLGFMFLAVGVGAYASGIFHLVTHAFFKALLFLGAGSVMHALHGELDIRKMGNLRAKMPVTHWTFLIGAAALAGIPPLSGFFSKDEILYGAFKASPLLWLIGAATAFMTAVYAFRAFFLTFWGEQRNERLFEHTHESPRIMTIPLITLAIGAAVAGVINLPRLLSLEHWLEPVFEPAYHMKSVTPPANDSLMWLLMAFSGVVAIAGAFLAYRAFLVNTEIPRRVRSSLGGFGRLVEDKYRVDELYNAAIVAPIAGLARWFAGPVDQRAIDGAVNGVAGLTGNIGERVRRIQVGQVGIYALSMLLGAVAIIIWLAVQSLGGDLR
jgi:NADH-quinone oxidoreductase subunit L